MENNNLNYIPYGAAALGAVLGNVLYKKYPKFGTAGRLLAIGIGAVSGYYISDKIIGGDDSDDFRNAAGGGCKKNRCAKLCGAGAVGITGICIGDDCICVDGDVNPKNQIKVQNNASSLTAVRNFYNAAGDRRRRKRCEAHANNELLCGGELQWDKTNCVCVR